MIRGEGPHPSLVLAQVQGLPPESLTVALMRGGRQFEGWGDGRYLAAETFDMIALVARAAGQWKDGKAPTIPPYPRPKPKSDGSAAPSAATPKKRTTVRDLFGRMSKQIGG